MAWGDKKTKTGELVAPTKPRSLIASASRIRLDDRSWNAYRFKDEAWQRELWRLYDIIPEFRFSANWVGSACSRVRIYVAKVDKLGRRGEEITGPPKVAALSETLFGAPTAKAEALRAMGINLTVAGECYILGLGGQKENGQDSKGDWFIVSPSELRRVVYGDGTKEVLFGERGSQRPLRDGQDILIRTWTPHPRYMQKADSPGRAVQPVLREIEQLTKFVFSQIDSRLVSAGIFPIPSGMDFPTDGDEDASASQTLMAKLAEAGAASLKGEGTAAGVLPLIIEVPIEALDKMKLINFASELSGQAGALRTEAIRRLSLGMDMPPEVLTGMGDSNHWSAWHIEESAVKIHIEPMMSRICDALTRGYLAPALQTLGLNPDEYCYWFDTSPLTVRPQRLQDTLNLYDKGIVGAGTVLESGAYLDSDLISEEDDLRRFTRELVLRDPTLITITEIQDIVGLPSFAPPALAPGAPPPPAPGAGITSTGPDPLPNPTKSTATNALGGPGGGASGTGGSTGNAVTASATLAIGSGSHERALALMVGADALVVRAMERAGTRLLDRGSQRGKFPGVPAYELHTKMNAESQEQIMLLLEGAWVRIGNVAEQLGVDPTTLQRSLTKYCTMLLMTSTPHHFERLRLFLRSEGLLDGGS
jgi:hypothetical protein